MTRAFKIFLALERILKNLDALGCTLIASWGKT